MALYFLFDDMRYNLLLYFSVLTIILELFGHEKIMPSLKKINAAPMVQTPAGDIGGILMSTKYGRNIHAYKGKVSGKVLSNSLLSLVAHRFGHVEFGIWNIIVIVFFRQEQLKKSKQIFKIRHVQIHELPRT